MTPSDDTKKKLADAQLDKVARVDHTGQALPKYLKFINQADRKGYAVIAHPALEGAKKEFVSKKLTLDEKKRLALAYIVDLGTDPDVVNAAKRAVGVRRSG